MKTSLYIIERLVVELINMHLSPQGLYLEKHEYSPQGYNIKNTKGEIVEISNDTKMGIKAFVEQGVLYNLGIGQSFHHEDHYLLLSFDSLKKQVQ